METGYRIGMFFLGGLVLGAVGATLVSRNSATLKPVAAHLLSRGIDAKDALMSKVDVMKEGVEDLVAEAKHASEERKEQAEEAAKA